MACCVVLWEETNTVFYSKNLIPTVRLGGGSVMVWGGFAASRPGRLALLEGTRNSVLYQRILQENVRPSVCELNHEFCSVSDNSTGECQAFRL